jgi:hypothetical protein
MALFPINTDVLMRPPSNPIANHIFNVVFQYNEGAGDTNDMNYLLLDDTDRSMIAISVDLPSFETTTVTRKFLGSEKSFPIYRKNGGDTTLTFYAHQDPNDNQFTVFNFFKYLNEYNNNQYFHYEQYKIFNRIIIKVGDFQGEEIYNYHLINCIVTKIEQGNLSYEGSEAVKFTMSVHYDDWYIE